MLQIARRTAAALALCLAAGNSFAQGHLRIGIGDDPDVLDPSLSRTYTARIVFATVCDKLFDIDEKAGHRPTARHQPRDFGRRSQRHHQAASRREVPRRRDLRCGRRQVQPRAPPQHEGLVPQARAGAGHSVEVVDPATIKLILKTPFSPLLAQLTDRAGMMVSPKAAEATGDKFGLKPVCAGPLQVRRARAAGPHRGREVRRLLEQGPGLRRQGHLPADRRRHGRLANLRSAGST
jgi:peptide/nickel transport system substrate-binding protein